jgi:hypothetical protein
MSSGTVPIDTDWAREAIRRKSEGQESSQIAIAVGKNAATVRKVLKAAREAGVLPEGPVSVAAANGNGHHDPIPGQTTVDDHLTDEEIDQRERSEALAEFQAESGPREMDAGGDEEVYVEEIRVDGTTQLGLFNSGGKAPDSASLRLSGGRILLLDGQAFRKGDTIRFSGTAVVREVAQRDKPDGKTGIVVSAEQKHVAQITDLRVE